MASNCGIGQELNPSVPCTRLDGQMDVIYLITKGLTIADQDAAKLKATIDALIQSEDIKVFPKIKTMEDQSPGTAYEDSSTGRDTVANGAVMLMANITANSELYTKIESYTGAEGGYDVFFSTEPGSLVMHKDSEGKLGGFSLDNFNVENPTLNDGAVAEKAPISIALSDNVEWRKERVVFRPSYNVKRLSSLSDVTLVIGATVNATTIEVNVYEMANNSDVMLANPVLGFVEEDFQLIDASGAAQTISGFGGGIVGTETYTLTGTAFVSGTLTLKIPELMTTQGYKAQNTLTITIP